mmetsp:Transcript_37823/g.48241  ORF Transcript_37823/g.48241 Transcript_37823/m.48241 type:complete len:142 (-) Transcript_37823:287-712(-)|eukprot:CAMPEP_0117797898 /NCGR_PEP_ID=MMETSP0948-20121206/12808_1 /TAXON_ID=44440 /ORGANISM="Chattonella subsalsa, Strain CCMP2191" /LENGTH=141 /DNA_ID=CAMNT_0005629393 /DNA_START=98 /DNA_END=523 /DNA_ORIENTATION=+
MNTIQNKLIPARFLSTLGHLIATAMVSYTKEDNIYAGLGNEPTEEEYLAAESVLDSAINAAVACFLLDFVGMFAGFTLFNTRVNAFQIAVHVIGSIQVSLLITEAWDYRKLWYIVGFCNFTTAGVEVFMILAIFILKTALY